jgi:Cache domain
MNIQVTGSAPIAATRPLPIGRRSRAVPRLVLVGLLLVAAIAASTVVILSHLRDRALIRATRELQSIALVLAVQTDRAFKAVELIQTGLIERLQALGVASAEDFERVMSGHEVHLGLKDKVTGWPHIGSITLINSQGKLFNFSRFWPLPNIDVTDREFFKVLKSDAQLTSFMGAPVRNRATDTWTIHLVRKVAGPNGEFLGLVLGAMEMQYFEEYFRTIALEEESSIALFRDDGAILARHPHVDPARLVVRAGGAASSALLSSILSRTEGGAVQQIGSLDGEERVIVAHRLAHYPFVVMTTTTVAAALADWRHAAGFLIGAAGLLALVLGASILVGVRRFRREQRLAALRAWKAEAASARPRA